MRLEYQVLGMRSTSRLCMSLPLCIILCLKQAVEAASDGSAEAPGRRPELPSFPGAARVLSRKGSVPGVCSPLQRRGPGFCLAAPLQPPLPGVRSGQLQLQPQPTSPQPGETQAAASVLLFRHLPGTPEPLSHRVPAPGRRLPSPSPPSPEDEARKAARAVGRGEGAAEARAAELRPASQVRQSEPGGVATKAGGRTPALAVGDAIQNLGKVPALGEGGSTGGRVLSCCVRREPPVVFSTLAIRCLPWSCGVAWRPQELPHARTHRRR